MKRVYVLRHAKSSWKDASLPDRERPLAGRGRRAAKAMALHVDEARPSALAAARSGFGDGHRAQPGAAGARAGP